MSDDGRGSDGGVITGRAMAVTVLLGDRVGRCSLVRATMLCMLLERTCVSNLTTCHCCCFRCCHCITVFVIN